MGHGCNLQLAGTIVSSCEKPANSQKASQNSEIFGTAHILLRNNFALEEIGSLKESRSQNSNRQAATAFPERETEYGDGTVGIAEG
jgi:hypothetical protein